MKLKMNNDSEEGFLLQKVVRQGLVGLTLAIIFLSGIALWAVIQLTDYYKNEVELITAQEKLLHSMRIAARERTLTLYSMFVADDILQKYDMQVTFYNAGADYVTARDALLKTHLTKHELTLIGELLELTTLNGPVQRQALDFLISNQNDLALNMLQDKVVPGQKQALQVLEKLHLSIESRYSEIKNKADLIGKTSIIILVGIVIVIVLGAIYIFRKTTFRSSNIISQLTDTREALQNTIYELIQQKETLDQHAIVSITDRKGNINYANDKFCEISGYSREELVGSNHRILKSGKHKDEFYQKLWDTISHGKVWHGEICNRRKDGSNYWVESTISPFLDVHGKPYQYIAIRTDITHLLEAKLEAEKANQAKSTFLSSMSHELRTPMNAIIGFSQILQSELTGKPLDLINEINKAGSHLLALINDVLDLSKIEAGQFDIFLDDVDVGTLITECLGMVEYTAHEKNINLLPQIETYTNVHVLADRIRLKQSVLNFLSNAIKYNSKNGDVVISVKAVEPGKYRILVEDSGSGLTAEQCAMIFKPFTRLDEHMNIVEGTGIGLTITKTLIENMNGKVGVESEQGKGSVFWIELPAVKNDPH